MKCMEKKIVYLEYLLKKNSLYSIKWQKEQSEEILGVEFLKRILRLKEEKQEELEEKLVGARARRATGQKIGKNITYHQ